jgi:hypothetical protein
MQWRIQDFLKGEAVGVIAARAEVGVWEEIKINTCPVDEGV